MRFVKNISFSGFLPRYLLALLLLGMSYCFFLPPFEGQGEYAHYSSIRQFAHTGYIPVYGEARIDDQLLQYGNVAPVPYRDVEPYNPVAARSYKAFSQDLAAQNYYQRVVRGGEIARSTFMPSSQLNFEAYHSVFYSALMAPFARMAILWPLYSELVLFRIITFCMALGGVFFAYKACLNAFGKANIQVINFAFAAYPLLFPQFFLAFTRVGNDALALLFSGLFLYFLSQEKELPIVARPWRMGIALGLGVLANVFLMPVLFFLLMWLWLVNYLQHRHHHAVLLDNFHQIKKVALVALLFGAWWYLERWLYFGQLAVSFNLLDLPSSADLYARVANAFLEPHLGLAVKNIWWSWHWLGGASRVDLSWLTMAPLLLMGALLFIAVIRFVAQQKITSIYYFLGICLGGLLIYHGVISMLRPFPRYTVHFQIAMPMVVFLLSAVFMHWQKSIARWQMVSTIGILIAFHLYATWSLLAVFAGCAMKGPERQIMFTEPWMCLSVYEEVFRVNSVLSNMPLAGLSFVIGLALLALFAIRASKVFDPVSVQKF